MMMVQNSELYVYGKFNIVEIWTIGKFVVIASLNV
jgi:hypothetical protein